MREFKVVRMTRDRKKLYEDFLMFENFETADTWAQNHNAQAPGSVIDVAEVSGKDDTKYGH